MALGSYLTGLVVLAVVARFLYPRSSKLDVETVGRSQGFLGSKTSASKSEFVSNGRKLVKDGYNKVSCDIYRHVPKF